MKMKKVVTSFKRKFDEEEGQISEPPRAKKLPRGVDPLTSRNIAKTARTPQDQAGSSRGAPQDRGVLERERVLVPEAPKKVAKRLAGNYEGCKPAELCRPPSFYCYNPIPRISNLPDPRTGIMMSEDNALAASQAVANTCQADANHYVNKDNIYEEEWIHKDLMAGAARFAVAADASRRLYLKVKERSFKKSQDIRTLKEQLRKMEEKVKDLEKGEEAMKMKLDLTEKELAIEKEELSLVKRREEEMTSKVSELVAEIEKSKELGTDELERIRAAHFEDWLGEFAETKEGNDWLKECGKGARAEGFWDAVHIAKAKYPDIDVDFLMTKLTGCEGIAFRENGEAYDADEGDAVTANVFSPGVGDFSVGSPTGAQNDSTELSLMVEEMQELIDDVPPTNAANHPSKSAEVIAAFGGDDDDADS